MNKLLFCGSILVLVVIVTANTFDVKREVAVGDPTKPVTALIACLTANPTGATSCLTNLPVIGGSIKTLLGGKTLSPSAATSLATCLTNNPTGALKCFTTALNSLGLVSGTVPFNSVISLLRITGLL